MAKPVKALHVLPGSAPVEERFLRKLAYWSHRIIHQGSNRAHLRLCGRNVFISTAFSVSIEGEWRGMRFTAEFVANGRPQRVDYLMPEGLTTIGEAHAADVAYATFADDELAN